MLENLMNFMKNDILKIKKEEMILKQLVMLLVLLVACFLGSWTYRIKTPVNRPDEYAEGYDASAGAWWNTGKVEVDDEWKLDPEIPLNYMPVPGEDELYMVIDNDGKIIGYRKRTKQIDGSWKWEDVNPDIPDNYEPVEGLENVYKVTAEDGTVKYYKYVRNDDDTYAFVEVDSEGNELNKNKDATTIDGKHVHITGNVYSKLNDHGVVIGYEKRVDNGDGTFSWVDTELPKLSNLDDAAGKLSLPSSGNLNAGSLDTSDMDKMAGNMAAANAAAANGSSDTYNVNVNINQGGNGGTTPGSTDITPDKPTIINNGDGTHTEVEVVKETKNIDGWTSTYETYVKKTYDDAGNLVSTISEGPYEVDTKQNITKETEPVQGDTSKKQDTLSGEVARVTGNYTYKTDIANEMFALLNAQRSKNGLGTLTMSDTAMQIAQLRAADMAGYDTSSETLPTYGSLGAMLSDYKVTSSAPGENLWKSIARSADDIHTRFQALDSARKTRMSKDVTQYGVAVCESNGYYYICEVCL